MPKGNVPVSDKRERFTVHPGSGAYIAKVLHIRYPNLKFTVPDESDVYIYGQGRYRDEKIDGKLSGYIYNDIAVLTIVWQLSGGAVGQYIHG